MMPHSAARMPGERQADPERQAEGRRQQRVGIGADGVEGDVAEIEQAGEADHDVQAPAEHHVDQDLDAVIVDPLQRAAAGPSTPSMMIGNRTTRPSMNGPTCRENQARAGDGGATPSPSRAASASAPPMPPAATAPTRSNQMRQSDVRQLAQEDESEDDRGEAERQRPAAGQHQFVVDVGFGVIGDDRKRQAEGDERRRRPRCAAPVRPAAQPSRRLWRSAWSAGPRS